MLNLPYGASFALKMKSISNTYARLIPHYESMKCSTLPDNESRLCSKGIEGGSTNWLREYDGEGLFKLWVAVIQDLEIQVYSTQSRGQQESS